MKNPLGIFQFIKNQDPAAGQDCWRYYQYLLENKDKHTYGNGNTLLDWYYKQANQFKNHRLLTTEDGY